MAKKKIEYSGKVMGGCWNAMSMLMDTIKAAEGKNIVVTVSEMKRKRSLNQNSFYFGVVVEQVREFFKGYGNDMDSEQTHVHLKEHVGKLIRYVNIPEADGTFTARRVLMSSKELSTEDWENYITKIRVWGAELGLMIKFPNE